MKSYSGHRSWNAWNVALWISNDEPLYRYAVGCLTRITPKGKPPTLYQAVSRFMEVMGGEKTPDGAIYNRLSVKECLKSLVE